MKKFRILIYFLFLFKSFNLFADNSFYEIKAEFVDRDKKTNTVTAKGNAEAKNYENKTIYADKIIYNKDLDIITTEGNSKFYDNKKTTIYAESFEYDLKLRTIYAYKNVIIKYEDDEYHFDDFKYYEVNESGTGNKFVGKLKDGSTVISDIAEFSKVSGIKILTNAKFTPCKEISDEKNQFCPSWSTSSSSALHDKEEKSITYKNAILYLKNIPVLYTPYLKVPDPSVKRQSGFLPPSFQKLSNIATTFKVPYFWAISDNKDLTITPVFYSKEKNLYMANYRHKFENANLEIDTSYTSGYDNLDVNNRTAGSRNHFFLKYNGDFKKILFDYSNLNIQLQRVSQSTYLLVNKINTSLVKEDIRNLDNFFELNSYGNNQSLSLKTQIFQNLDASNNPYEYISPYISYSKYFSFLNQNINLENTFLNKSFNSNQNQTKFSNVINTSSPQYVLGSVGLGSIFRTNLTNINLNNDNVIGQKQDVNSDLNFTVGLENSYPLYKKNKDLNITQNIIPKLFFRYTTGSTPNLQTNGKTLSYVDIISMNRMNDGSTPETGFSTGVAVDWTLSKQKNDETVLSSNFSIGQVFKNSKDMNMPTSSSLQSTSSDIVGYYSLDIFGEKKSSENNIFTLPIDILSQNKLNLSYEFNIKNNLSSIIKNSISVTAIYNKNYLGTSYQKASDHIGDSHYATINYKKILFDSYILDLETKRNFSNNFTEYTQFGFFKEDDCLKFGLGYKQDGYNNKDSKSNKSLYFTITFKPFGETNNYDLSSFVR